VKVITDASILDNGIKGKSGGYQLTLLGRTRDISETGAALVIPSLSLDEAFCRDKTSSLRVEIDLPTAPVKFNSTPVYCRRLNEGEARDGYLIGLRITEMSAEDSQRFRQFLDSQRG
jgi:hypothetical protein